jgi:hypothetical protein
MFENRPTQIAGLLYVLFVILFVVVIALHTTYWKPLLMILLLTFPFALINLYDIDCVFNGQCNVWGWIKGIFFIVYLIFAIVVTILLLTDFQKMVNSAEITNNNNDDREKEK